MSLIQTIETDLSIAGKWLVTEVEGEATAVWNVVKTVFNAAEPTIVSGVLGSIQQFAMTIENDILHGTPLDVLEQNFIQWAETEGLSLEASAKTLGSNLLQALIALVVQTHI